MNQYSPKNQAFLLSQLPTATDVRPFKAWKAAGRSVIKGEKALRVWIPKVKGDGADPEKLTDAERERRFVRGPVFDISQTQPTPPRKMKGAASARVDGQLDAMYTAYDAAIAAGEIPADLDFSIWYELTTEARNQPDEYAYETEVRTDPDESRYTARVAAASAPPKGIFHYEDYAIEREPHRIQM